LPIQKPNSPVNNSYGQILKSSSILGGAQGINYLIAMARTKVVAILLGPEGIGLVSLYQSIIDLVGNVAGLGIASSGVREVAEACASSDSRRIAVATQTLKRLSWITGLLGWLVTAALSYPLSQWILGSHLHAGAIALLGVSLLFGMASGGQMACIQGMRRIGDLAKLQILSMCMSTAVAIGIYFWLKEKGILPVLISSAIISFAGSWWYASKLRIAKIDLDWITTWQNSSRLIQLGIAFMWSALMTAGVAFAIRAMITRDLGIEANGIFQSAWAISGMFAGFILSAMGTDFYPRLTAAAHDNSVMNKLVNEQTEVGLLLALPGLVGTIVFAPIVMKIFYSAKFVAGADLLPWMVLGILFKIISWPMGFIQLAKGATRWFIASETFFGISLGGLTFFLLKFKGLEGAAYSFVLIYLVYIILMLYTSKKLSNFIWNKQNIELFIKAGAIVAGSFASVQLLSQRFNFLIGIILCIISCIISWIELKQRVKKI
jgi:PST family polysaccharide transporter